MGFSSLLTTNQNLVAYWEASDTVQICFVLIGCPIVLLAINFAGVKVSSKEALQSSETKSASDFCYDRNSRGYCEAISDLWSGLAFDHHRQWR